jgi:hypothetical protein
MLIQQENIPWVDNILARVCSWLLLAAFLMFPGSFLLLLYAKSVPSAFDSAERVGFIVVAAICCGAGLSGGGCLWWRWHKNYVWLINRIFV